MIDAPLAWLYGLSASTAAWLCLAENIAVCGGALGLGALLLRLRRPRITPPPPPLTRAELLLATSTVLVNSVVTWLGFMLWRAGMITPVHRGVLRSVLDACALLGIMDAAMYMAHKVAHVPLFFRYIHALHHRYDAPRPLTLFVMHPVECAGFGALWLAILCICPASWGGIALYLTLNVLFGVVGHLGQEPLALPEAWARWLGTAAFHGGHHASPEKNYGFYTQLWDRLWRTGGT